MTCVCQENVELERQLRAELAEAKGQLTMKVAMTMCSNHYDNLCYCMEEEQLHSCEREKEAVRQQLISSQRWIQELRQRVSPTCETMHCYNVLLTTGD